MRVHVVVSDNGGVMNAQEDPSLWVPRSEADIQSGIEGGLLEESHYFDLKRELKAGSRPNTELARDLAQFGIDGGMLLIGVAEPSRDQPEQHPELFPVELAGLAERVESVARTKIDPPLPVTCHQITSSDPGRGYLVVQVPASKVAPHMVQGVYYGRGDKQRIRLSDAEVVRLHQDRQGGASTRVRDALSAYVRRDPATSGKHARLFMVALPLTPRAGMLQEVVRDQRLFERLIDVQTVDGLELNLNVCSRHHRRIDGAAQVYGLTESRELEQLPDGNNLDSAFEVEISEDGTVRMMTTMFSVGWTYNQLLLPITVPVLARQTVEIAARAAAAAGYQGRWGLGVTTRGHIAGIELHLPGPQMGGRLSRHWPADIDEYRSFGEVSTLDLHTRPGTVVSDWVGGFVRQCHLEENPTVVAQLADPDEG